MQDPEQEFQNLLSLDEIDRLKQSSILSFLRKETKYFLMHSSFSSFMPLLVSERLIY